MNRAYQDFSDWEFTQPLHDFCHECSRDEFAAFMAGYHAALQRVGKVTIGIHTAILDDKKSRSEDAHWASERFRDLILGLVEKAKREIPEEDEG